MLMAAGIPTHLFRSFALTFHDDDPWTLETTLPEGTHFAKLVFLPGHKQMVPRNYGDTAVSLTASWFQDGDHDEEPNETSPIRRVSQRRAPLIQSVVTLPNGVDHDVAVPDHFTLRETLSHCGLDARDLSSVIIFQGSFECDLDECISEYPDAQLTVRCKALRPVDHDPACKMIEIVKPSGITIFVQCDQVISIRDKALTIFPTELVAQMRASLNGKLISLDARMWDCDVAPLRLRLFPLRGGGPSGQPKGSSKGHDTLQSQDPWASFSGTRTNHQPKSGVRWDQLKLVDNHPFFCKLTGKKLVQVSVLQLGPQQSGIAFATKASLQTIQAVQDKTTTVVLLPASKGTAGIQSSDKMNTLKPQQIMVKDSSSSTPYMRLVLPVLLKGELDYKVHEPPNVISVDASQYCEMIIELHSTLMSQATHVAMTEHPLEAMKRIVAAVGVSMNDVAVYSYKKFPFHDEKMTHQAILKLPAANLITMLNISGKSELFTRQFITDDTKLTHSIVPRFWPITQEDLRRAVQLGLSLEDGFRGIALSKRGLAIRVDDKAIARARNTILQGDSRFCSLNVDVVVKVLFIAQGFPFAMSTEAIVTATKQATGLPPVPVRSFRISGLLSWVLGFAVSPSTLQFAIKVDGIVHEILLSVQENSKPAKQVRRQIKNKKNQGGDSTSSQPKHTMTHPFPQPAVANQDDARITLLESKVASLEVNQSKLSERMDNRFDQMANQLQQVLAAVSPPSSGHGRQREGHSGETPPSKTQRS